MKTKSALIRSYLWCAIIAVTAPTTMAISPTRHELASSANWSAVHFGSHKSTPPFSFTYGGQHSSQLLAGWQVQSTKRKLDAARTERTLVWTDPKTRLMIRCVAVEYQDYPAVEWTAYFQNGGENPTPIIEHVEALDTTVNASNSNETFVLYHAEGSHEKITDFQPFETPIRPGESVRLASFGGRSSDGCLPFFNLTKSSSGGIMFGIGWTGQWAASFNRSESRVNIRAGMELTHLTLYPGEEIRMPAILMLFWSGKDRIRGQNLLRQLLKAQYTPMPEGKPADPPFAVSPHAAVKFEDTTEVNQVEAIENLFTHHLKPDYWWIDAGWYQSPGNNWARGVGNWIPDPVRYPNGMKPVADAAHKAGMKFLLWFEPERVMPDTWLYNNHPEWLLQAPADLPPDLAYQYNDGFHLLNLGNPEALAWAEKRISGMITSIGIDCYRNDFNMYPVFYWRNGEPPDRQGMNEIRYVTGLYAYFDTLRRDHPALLTDNCASGGRRIDFEMLRRALVFTRSDYLWDPIGQQCHTYGLAQWIPITGIGAAAVNPYNCRSGLGSHFALAFDVYSKDHRMWNLVKKAREEHASLKQLYTGDFYPLGDYSIKKDTWMAWQFDRPDLGKGLMQAFRRQESSEATAVIPLCGLDSKSSYAVRNLDREDVNVITGRDLMVKGVEIHMEDKPSAVVLAYERIVHRDMLRKKK